MLYENSLEGWRKEAFLKHGDVNYNEECRGNNETRFRIVFIIILAFMLDGVCVVVERFDWALCFLESQRFIGNERRRVDKRLEFHDYKFANMEYDLLAEYELYE